MKYRYTSPKGTGYFILTFDDTGKLTNSFSNFERSIMVFQTGLRWTGYCAELDITGYGIDKIDAYRKTEKEMNLWIAKSVKDNKIEKNIIDLGFTKQEIH